MSNRKIPRSPVERGIFCSLFPVSCVCPVLAGIPAILLSVFLSIFLSIYFSVHFSGIVCRHLLYVHSAGLYPAYSSSIVPDVIRTVPPLIHSSTHPLTPSFLPPPVGRVGVGLYPRSAFPFLYPPILADWKCRFVPLPLHGGVGGGFLIYDFLSFSAFFSFPSCIFHFFVVPLHPITIL